MSRNKNKVCKLHNVPLFYVEGDMPINIGNLRGVSHYSGWICPQCSLKRNNKRLKKYGDGVVAGINTLLIDLKAAYDKADDICEFGRMVEELLMNHGVDLDDETGKKK